MAETTPSEKPRAELWPSTGDDPGAGGESVEIRIYVVTGRHGIFDVPERFCRECNLFVGAADAAAERVDVPVDVRVVSWWTRFLGALRYGGYHPPVMVVDGEKLCQGHHVPAPEEVTEAIEASIDR